MDDHHPHHPQQHSEPTATESAALKKAKPYMGAMKDHILSVMTRRGDEGLTPHEYLEEFDIPEMTARKRFVELRQDGMIRADAPRARPNARGNKVEVYVIGEDTEYLKPAVPKPTTFEFRGVVLALTKLCTSAEHTPSAEMQKAVRWMAKQGAIEAPPMWFEYRIQWGPEENEVSAMKLFTLKKTPKDGVCDANRCKATETSNTLGDLWGQESAKLCATHTAAAIAFAEANPGYEPPKVEAPPVQHAALATELEGEQKVAKGQLDFIRNFEIETQEDLEEVAGWLREVKQKRIELETKEKGITGPMNTALQKVRDLFRPAKTFWADAEVILKAKIAAQKILEAQNNAKAMRAAADAHAQGDPAATVAAIAQVKSTHDLEGIVVVSKWAYVIEDESLLPREFLTPNLQLLKEHCSHSTDRQPTPIAGVKFIPDAQIRASAATYPTPREDGQ